jgi:hypothetical protein
MELSTVHTALSRAQEKSKQQTLVTSSYKVDPEKKELAEMICLKNGTTLSEFVRQAIECLVEDYTGKK